MLAAFTEGMELACPLQTMHGGSEWPKLHGVEFACTSQSWKKRMARIVWHETAQMTSLLCAGYTYVILVTRTRRNHIYRYRIVRPNNIFQPLVTSHFVRSNYKKVWVLLRVKQRRGI